jgi:hypothetical protein
VLLQGLFGIEAPAAFLAFNRHYKLFFGFT